MLKSFNAAFPLCQVTCCLSVQYACCVCVCVFLGKLDIHTIFASSRADILCCS